MDFRVYKIIIIQQIGNSTTYADWDYLGGLNYTKHPNVYEPDKYAINQQGFLLVQNATIIYNGTEFKAEVMQKNDVELLRLHRLFVFAENGY